MERQPIPSRRFWSRETRLLLITVAVSLGALLVLARFRFPDQEPLELPTQPLQRLAARAAFDDLSAAVARAAERVRPALDVIELNDAGGTGRSMSLEDILWRSQVDAGAPLSLAYRFRSDAAVVVAHARPWPVVVSGYEVAGQDELRGVTVLRHASAPDDWQPLGVSSLSSPQYLLVAEPTRAGVALRPLFGGSAGSFIHPQWNQPLLALGQGVSPENGALVFSLDGAFAGAVVNRLGVRAIVPAEALLGEAERLLESRPGALSTIGVHLQPLSAHLRNATGANSGAIVTQVDPTGPAAEILAVGDVIGAVAGRLVPTPEQALLSIAQLAPNNPATIQVLRGRKTITLAVKPIPIDRVPVAVTEHQLGLKLRNTPGGVYVESVIHGSAAAEAGFRAGDVITRVAGDTRSGPGDVAAEWEQLARGASILIAIDRGGTHILLGLSKR
jgi:hypothetical protein